MSYLYVTGHKAGKKKEKAAEKRQPAVAAKAGEGKGRG